MKLLVTEDKILPPSTPTDLQGKIAANMMAIKGGVKCQDFNRYTYEFHKLYIHSILLNSVIESVTYYVTYCVRYLRTYASCNPAKLAFQF